MTLLCIAASAHLQITHYCYCDLCGGRKEQLNFNVNKCCLMLISHKHSHSIVPPLFIKAGVAVEQVDSVKHLGVLLTSDLMWTEPTSRI